MKVAIHHTPNIGFSQTWYDYCMENNIEVKLVNVYDSDIVLQLADCDAFLWHHHQNNYRDVLFAKQLLFSLERKGLRVFPNYNTTWHFDDKIGQKYLLEALNLPLVPSYIFYNKKDAMRWIASTSFPKVFKLRGGAGSLNVRLVKNARIARALTRKAFGRGFTPLNSWVYCKDRIRKFWDGKDSLLGFCKGIGRLILPAEYTKMHPREKGYIYFQDFIPDNNFDIRIIVTGDKAIGIKRVVRKGDFRASGSGDILYAKEDIDERCIKIAFDCNKKIQSQSIAFDFVFSESNSPLLVEISYGYSQEVYYSCVGYWDESLNFYPGKVTPVRWIIENLLK